jgi:hypothetical protein
MNLTRVAYEKSIKSLLQNDVEERFHVKSVEQLGDASSFVTKLRQTRLSNSSHDEDASQAHAQGFRRVAVVTYSQTGSNDVRLLSKLCSAFGLESDSYKYGSHRGLIRFGLGRDSPYEVFLLGSSSEYFKFLSDVESPTSSSVS